MSIRLRLLILGLLVVVCFGQQKAEPAYQQSVKTSTTYSTQILTLSTTEMITKTRTTLATVVLPPPPELDVKFSYERWYYTTTGLLAHVVIRGNVTNLSEQLLWDLRLKFELGEGDKSEPFYHIISVLNPGELKKFEFEHDVGNRKYNYQWVWVRYRGIDNYSTPVKTATVVRTSLIQESTQSIGVVTLTTIQKIEYTYTESAPSAASGLSLVVVVVAAAAVAIAVVIYMRKRSAQGPSVPPSVPKPEPTPTVPPSHPSEQPSELRKLCPECQTQNEARAKFCVNCGHRF